MAAALAKLPAAQRRLLIEHEVLGVPTAGAALQQETTTGAVAARLSRARARLRLDYLLAFRRIQLPTPRCRPVLMAISLGDRRRQSALGAGSHLIACRTCAELRRTPRPSQQNLDRVDSPSAHRHLAQDVDVAARAFRCELDSSRCRRSGRHHTRGRPVATARRTDESTHPTRDHLRTVTSARGAKPTHSNTTWPRTDRRERHSPSASNRRSTQHLRRAIGRCRSRTSPLGRRRRGILDRVDAAGTHLGAARNPHRIGRCKCRSDSWSASAQAASSRTTPPTSTHRSAKPRAPPNS